MEPVVSLLTCCSVFVGAMLVRIALLSLALMLLAVPVLAVLMGVRGAEMLWHLTTSIVSGVRLQWKTT